jgi:hypothetical protein
MQVRWFFLFIYFFFYFIIFFLDLLSVLEQFRDGRDVHRLFIRKADAQTGERDLVGVVTQSDILRWLNSATFEAKSTKIGEVEALSLDVLVWVPINFSCPCS